MRLLICLLPALAFAQEKLDPDTEIARRHFEAGRLSYEASDYDTALHEFEAARKVRQFPAFDYNIARCLDRLERPAEAIAAYERYLAAIGGDHPDTREVRERVRVLKERIAEPSPAPVVAEPSRNKRWVAPSVVAGLTVATAVVGAGLIGSVSVDYDRMLSGPSSCRPCSDSQVAPLRARADAAYAMFALSGALAVVDVVLWLRARRR
jgi:tetratricopeptide (TPR) repeat protein